MTALTNNDKINEIVVREMKSLWLESIQRKRSVRKKWDSEESVLRRWNEYFEELMFEENEIKRGVKEVETVQ